MDHVTPEARETVEAVEGVHLTQLAAGERMSIQHLRMAPGASVPEHDHHHEQLGFVYQGVQRFVLDDGSEHDVAPGESYYLESGEPHGAVSAGEEAVLAIDIFSPPRTEPPWVE